MRRLILIIAILTAPIMQNAWADSISVSCMNVNDYNFKWTDPGNACGVGDMALYGEAVASEYDYLLYTMNATSPSIPSAATIESLVVYVKGADAGATDTKIQFTDDVNGEVGYPYTVTWAASNIYRAYAGHGLWGTGWTSPTLFNDGFGYMIRLVPETDADYSSNNLTVDDLYMTIFYTLPPPDTALYAYIDSLHNDYNLATATTSPISGDSIGGGANWKYKANVISSNNVYARTPGNSTDSLIVPYFGLDIPDDPLVMGLKAEIECYSFLGDVNVEVGLTWDGSTLANGSSWYTITAPEAEAYVTAGCDTCTWGLGAMGSMGSAGWFTPSTFGLLIKKSIVGLAAESVFIDHVRVTAHYVSENDSIIVYAETGTQSWPDSVIFCADTIQAAWPDTDTYSWRSAMPYTANTGFEDTLVIYNRQDCAALDTVYLTVYIKDNTSGYSAPVHYWRRFGDDCTQPVYQDSTAWLRPGTVRVENRTTTTWLLPDSIKWSDDYYASFTGTNQKRIVLYNFNANLPSWTTLKGIAIKYEGHGHSTTVSRRQIRTYLTNTAAVNCTTMVGTKEIYPQTLPNTIDGLIYAGSAIDLWGTTPVTLPIADINSNTKFGVVIRDNDALTAAELALDQVTVKFYYTPCYDSNSFRVDDPDGSYPYKDDGTFGHGVGLFLLDGGEGTCGRVDGATWEAAWRFHNRIVPANSTIDSAWILATSFLTSTNDILSRLYGEAADSASSFDGDTTAWKARTRTSAYIDWDITDDWTAGTTYRSPYITTIIQEIVSRSNWKLGKSIVIFWQDDGTSGTTSRQQIRSEDFADGPGAAVLNIWWHCYGGAAPNYARRNRILKER